MENISETNRHRYMILYIEFVEESKKRNNIQSVPFKVSECNYFRYNRKCYQLEHILDKLPPSVDHPVLDDHTLN